MAIFNSYVKLPEGNYVDIILNQLMSFGAPSSKISRRNTLTTALHCRHHRSLLLLKGGYPIFDTGRKWILEHMMKASSSKDLPWDPNPSLSLPPIDKTTGWNPVNPGFHRLLTSPLSDSHGKWTGWVWGRDGLWPFRSDWRSACLLVELPATLPNTYVPTREAGKKNWGWLLQCYGKYCSPQSELQYCSWQPTGPLDTSWVTIFGGCNDSTFRYI